MIERQLCKAKKPAQITYEFCIFGSVRIALGKAKAIDAFHFEEFFWFLRSSFWEQHVFRDLGLTISDV